MKKGMALISVLLLSILLIMIGVSMVFISTNHLHLMGNVESYNKALKAAEAGAEYALAQLNASPAWAEPNSPPPEVTKTLKNNSEFIITFDPNDDYYSYNNLFGSSVYTRPSGDLLSGDVPAYTAEIISVGKSPDGITKILRVLYIRDDAMPANGLACGEISFYSGTITFAGETIDEPGWLYSAWEDPDPSPTPSIYSWDLGDSRINANGGMLSAKGAIDVDYLTDPNDFYVDEYTNKDLQAPDIDIDQIMSDAKLDPGVLKISNDSYSVVSIHGIKDSAKEKLLNKIYDEKALEGMASTYSDSPPSLLPSDPNDVYRQHVSLVDAEITNVEGVPDHESWFSGELGNDTSWLRIEGTATVTENYNEYRAVYDYTDPVLGDIYKWSDPVSDSRTHSLDGNSIYYDLEDTGEYWGGGASDSGYYDTEVAFTSTANLDKGSNPEKDETIIADGERLDNCFTLEKTSDGYMVSLERDIYTTPSVPKTLDYTKSLDEVESEPFSIKRIYDLGTETTGEDVLYVPLDMKGHSLYSEGHVALGLEVRNSDTDGNGGLIVSQGKLGYLYGFEAQPLIPVSKDDLYLSISEEGQNYALEGYMYTENDVIIEPMDNSSEILGGLGTIESYGGKVKITNCKNYPAELPLEDPEGIIDSTLYVPPTKTYMVKDPDDPAGPPIEEEKPNYLLYAREADGERYIVPERYSEMIYTDAGGEHKIDFQSYQLHFVPEGGGDFSTEIYKSVQFTLPDPPVPGVPSTTYTKYVEIPFDGTDPDNPAAGASSISLNSFYQDTGLDDCADPSTAINEIGSLFYKNYLESEIELKGRIVANNEYNASHGDNNGNQSIYIAPGGYNSVFNSMLSRGNLNALVNARGEDFTIRRVCWEVIR